MRPNSASPSPEECCTMRTGMNLLLWATHVNKEHYPILAKLKQTGFDGVEIPIFEGDDNHYKQLRKELDNQGLRCTTVGLMTPDANPISPDAALREAAVERFRRLIGWTAILGADLLAGAVFFPPGGLPPGAPAPGGEKRGAGRVSRGGRGSGERRA